VTSPGSRSTDPRRFWNYVIAALRTADASLGASSLARLHAPGTDVMADVLPALLDELTQRAEPMVLVLDDYHLIHRAEIHEQLAYLVEHAGESLAILLLTRVEPPLPLGRLRARGELLELDTESLRFDSPETESLLNRVLRLDLTPAQVATLRRRTEGWAAGLYLAAISMRGAGDPRGFVAQFAGDDRNIVDYLGAEVLAAQPPRVRELLLRTSVLDRFCAPLVEAVAGIDRADSMLREIERADLFLVPLDSRREWYRYHHLFRELLRHELAAADPELIPELHRRAARWHLDGGLVSEGIEHTIAAGDTAAAAELIAEHWAPTLLGAAGDRVVEGWLEALGPDAIAADVRLCFARCFIALSYGRMEDVARWLAIAERAPLPGRFRDGVTSVAGALACMRAAYLWETGDAGGARRAGYEVLEEEGEGSPWRAIGVATIGLSYGAVGDWSHGREWMHEYGRLGHAFGQHLNEASGLGSAAYFDAERGEWESAERLAGRSLEISAAHGIDEHWSSAGGHMARGMILERGGDPEGAEAEIARGRSSSTAAAPVR
jgi:LuxR family transcriptional regulator, maltose regulon positive regulatory protein